MGSTPPAQVPPWPVEGLLARIGRGTNVLGRALDRLARGPSPLSWVVKLMSSVGLGLVWLFLIGAYVGVGSGMAWVRARMEMTDLQFFDAWPMVALMILLCVNLMVVTLRRIPLNIFKFGVWMVHVGIITLVASCCFYFSLKQEGSVRAFLNQPVDHYYDVTDRALYVLPPGVNQVAAAGMSPLPTLPIYYEHIAELGNPLNIMVQPAQPKELNIRITGYYPYATMSSSWAVGPAPATPAAAPNPAVAFHLVVEGQTFPQRWLIGRIPAQRVEEPPDRFGLEYLYRPTAARVAELTSSFEGQAAITVRVPAAKVERTYVAQPGVPIAVAGTTYTVTPEDVMQMPMLSHGYENTASTALTVAVKRQDAPDKAFEFKRMAVFRYPERSPDFLLQDGRMIRKQEGVDSGIQIIFHDASRDQLWLLEDAAGQLTLVQRATGGKVTQRVVRVGAPVEISLAGIRPFVLVVDQQTPNAVPEHQPVIIPPQQRQRNATATDAMANSMIEVEVSRGSWHSAKVYVPFVQFGATEPPYGLPPTPVDVPELGAVNLVFSNLLRPLPSTLTLEAFRAVKDAHTVRTYANYISTLRVDPPGGPARELVAQLNAPAADAGFYYFQSAWDGHDDAGPGERFSVIGVGNRPGIPGMITGALLIFFGIGYAFYVKPMLLNARKRQLKQIAGAA